MVGVNRPCTAFSKAAAIAIGFGLILTGCGGKELAQLQADALVEAAGPVKEEQKRFEQERRAVSALNRKEDAQEIEEGKARSRKLMPEEGEGGGGGGAH